jgi:dienelactone hydrolase
MRERIVAEIGQAAPERIHPKAQPQPQTKNRWPVALDLTVGVLFLLAIARLAQLDQGGPGHASFELPGHEPATLYMPGPGNPFFKLFPPPPSERPPAVVLIHGFSGDRLMMSVLARRIAANGYAVMTIDVHGHGENRNPFSEDLFVSHNSLHQDVKEAVDFFRGLNLVDGSRIVVMGHSMGAGAALEYATSDPTLQGAVMISGGWTIGANRPKNALFIFADGDPSFIQQTSSEIAAHLAGVSQSEPGKTYGDFKQGNAVEAVRVPGVDHIRIINSAAATETIVRWLDSTFQTKRSEKIKLAEPRPTVATVALVLFLILLVPIGRACGNIARSWPENLTAPRSSWSSLLIVAGALLAAMPLVATMPPVSFVPLVVGDVEVSWFAVAGLILVGGFALTKMFDRYHLRETLAGTLGSSLLAAAIGVAVIYVCDVATSWTFLTFHRLSLTPERLLAAGAAMVLLFPFWGGFELLVRRGSLVTSTVVASIGRLLILILMAVGAILGILPGVVMLVLPIIAMTFVTFEIFAASAFSTSRNLLLVALVESAWFALNLASTSPITFML